MESNTESLYGITQNLLKNAGIHLKKRLGQNFLIERNIFDLIIKSANLSPDDVVLELGSGIGLLTREIALSFNKVIAVELDSDLFRILQSYCKDFDNITLINADMLEFDYAKLFSENGLSPNQKIKVIGNLPYYITSPTIFKFLELKSLPIKSIILMVQKEVGERIVSPPGKKDYGSLTVAIAYRCKTRIIKTISAGCFYPKPKVDSVLIELAVQDKPNVSVNDENLFFSVVRSAFQHRRKTLRNALMLSIQSGKLKTSIEIMDNAIQSLGLDPKIRGECLSIEKFANLANMIYNRHET
ncbi:MAG: 16S rRNA (adenine(1518)-N(6)/adenine(1519)-N(6))-dimethyltransferase RsmA [Candidatus Poribacteria bacterium]